ncbi:MAG: SDR family NAD(P)-dependent oxidoreductase [Pseudomonadota bacterium]
MTALEGQTAWITGGGGGIGEASAKALAAAGAHAAISGRRAAELERVAAEIAAAGGSAEVLPLDVCDAEAVKQVAEGLKARRGGVDILVANAGMNVLNRAGDRITMEDFAAVVDVNVNGVMNTTLAVLPHMRAAGGGTIMMVSSWAGRHASKLTGPAYNASKHAVVALSHSINQEEAVNGVRCCVIMPGEVATPILDKRPRPPSAEERARMLQAEDLGRVVRFVAESPAHVCLNEILISPTHNRLFVSSD